MKKLLTPFSFLFKCQSSKMADVQPIDVDEVDEETRRQGLMECSELLRMARRVLTIVDTNERLEAMSTVTVMFECVAEDESGPDGGWNGGVTDGILDELRAATPNREGEAIDRLVQFLEEVLE